MDQIAHNWRKLKLFLLFAPSTSSNQMGTKLKNDSFLDMSADGTAHKASYEIQQTEPVNSNTANLCSSLLLFWEMQCTSLCTVVSTDGLSLF